MENKDSAVGDFFVRADGEAWWHGKLAQLEKTAAQVETGKYECEGCPRLYFDDLIAQSISVGDHFTEKEKTEKIAYPSEIARANDLVDKLVTLKDKLPPSRAVLKRVHRINKGLEELYGPGRGYDRLFRFIDPDVVYWWDNKLISLEKEVDAFEKNYASCEKRK